jgi:hypothetical protein
MYEYGLTLKEKTANFLKWLKLIVHPRQDVIDSEQNMNPRKTISCFKRQV